MNLQEFGQRIKQKHPQYNGLDDVFVAKKVIDKYPEYKSQVTVEPREKDGFFSRLGEDIRERISGVGEAFGKGLRQEQSPVSTAIQTVGEVAGGITDIGAEALMSGIRGIGKAASAVTPDFIEKPVVEKTKQVGLDILDSPIGKMGLQAIKGGTEIYQDFKQKYPTAAENLESVINMGDLLLMGKGSQIAKPAIEKGVVAAKKAIPKVGEIAKTTVKTPAKKTGQLISFGTSQFTGLNPKTIKTIIKDPKLYEEAEKRLITRESLGEKLSSGIKQRLDDLKSTGKEYDKLKASDQVAKIGEIDIKRKLLEKGIDVSDGKIKVDLGSDIQLSNVDQKGLEEVLDLINGKENLTAKEVLNLRTRLSNLSKFEQGKTNASTVIAKELRKFVDDVAKKDIKGLSELDAQFAPEVKFLNKIKKDYLNADGTMKDNALSKIASLNNRGKEELLKRTEKIIPELSREIKALSAIEDVELAMGQKVGTYLKAGLAGAAVSGGTGGMIGLILASPSISVPLLKTYGRILKYSQETINSIIRKINNGIKLTKNEAIKVGNIFKQTAKDIKGNQKGFVKIPGASDDLIKEAKKAKAEGKSFDEFVDSLPVGGKEGREVGRGLGYYQTKFIEPVGKTNKKIKVYRATNPKGEKIVDGDFVSFSKASASSYGNNVLELNLPENNLYKIGEKDLIYNSGKTKSQLKEIWEKANKSDFKKAGSAKVPDLSREARKYKTAEEFLNKKDTIYHGGKIDDIDDIVWDEFTGVSNVEKGDPIRVFGVNFDKDGATADFFATRGGGKILEVKFTPKKTKKFNTDNQLLNELLDMAYEKSGQNFWIDAKKIRGTDKKNEFMIDNVFDENLVLEMKDELIEQGFDSLQFKNTLDGGTTIIPLKKEAIKTSSQLKEIWEKANKK